MPGIGAASATPCNYTATTREAVHAAFALKTHRRRPSPIKPEHPATWLLLRETSSSLQTSKKKKGHLPFIPFLFMRTRYQANSQFN